MLILKWDSAILEHLCILAKCCSNSFIKESGPQLLEILCNLYDVLSCSCLKWKIWQISLSFHLTCRWINYRSINKIVWMNCLKSKFICCHCTVDLFSKFWRKRAVGIVLHSNKRSQLKISAFIISEMEKFSSFHNVSSFCFWNWRSR